MGKLSQGCAFKILKKIFSLESSVFPVKMMRRDLGKGNWVLQIQANMKHNRITYFNAGLLIWYCLAQVRYFYKANTGERWKANIEVAPTGKTINYQYIVNTANSMKVTIVASLSMHPPHQNTNEFLIRSKYIDSLKNVQKSDCQSNYDSKISGCVKYCRTENSWIIWDIFHLASWRSHRK